MIFEQYLFWQRNSLLNNLLSYIVGILYKHTLPFKSMGSVRLFVILSFSKDTLDESKVTVNTFLMLKKIYISYKCCSFILSTN